MRVAIHVAIGLSELFLIGVTMRVTAQVTVGLLISVTVRVTVKVLQSGSWYDLIGFFGV